MMDIRPCECRYTEEPASPSDMIAPHMSRVRYRFTPCDRYPACLEDAMRTMPTDDPKPLTAEALVDLAKPVVEAILDRSRAFAGLNACEVSLAALYDEIGKALDAERARHADSAWERCVTCGETGG